MEKEPEYAIGERVYVKSITSRYFEGPILDRFFDEGDWFYTIDGKNYLHEAMIARPLLPGAIAGLGAK